MRNLLKPERSEAENCEVSMLGLWSLWCPIWKEYRQTFRKKYTDLNYLYLT